MRGPWFILAALLLLVAPGAAQLTMTGVGGGFGQPAGGGGLTFTPTGNPAVQNAGFGAGPVTFSSVPIASGTVVVGVFNSQASNITGVNVTLNGTGMTKAVTIVSDRNSLWYLNGVSGSTANIVVSWATGGGNNIGILVGVISGSAQTSPSATAINAEINNPDPQPVPTPASTITVPTGGVAIIFGTVLTGTTGQVAAWTNTTNSAGDYTIEATTGNDTLMLAHSIATGAQSYTVTGTPSFSFSGFGATVIAWGP